MRGAELDMKQRDSVVVFGATGTVGAYTSLHLAQSGFKVLAVGRRSSDNGFFADNGIDYYPVNIRHGSGFSALPRTGVSSVVHLAGSMPSKMTGYSPAEYVDTVVHGTLNVLEYCRTASVSRIVFSQTRADSQYLMGNETPIPDDIHKGFPPTGDHSVYAICKNAAVDLIEHYFRQYALKRFILRLPTIYAYHPDKYYCVNGQRKIKAYRYLIDQAMSGLPVEVWGDPRMRKEIVYVKDLSRMIECCLLSNSDGGVYNVGTGTGVTLEEQIRGIVEVFCNSERISEIIYRPDKPNARQFIHDISKASQELGYQPIYDYRALLLDFRNEMHSQRFQALWGREGSDADPDTTSGAAPSFQSGTS